jgi:hypothetical protein
VIQLHEFDKCIISSVKGSNLGTGFVNEYDRTILKTCLDGSFTLHLQQEVLIFVFNEVKGECVYKGLVADINDKNVIFDKVSFVRSMQKRDNTRVDKTMRYRITLRFVGDHREKLETPFDITILNLSAQGMYISCDEPFAVGHRFPLVFKDAGKPIDLDVEIIRCEKYRRGNKYGCRFLNISEKDSDNIYRFVLHEQIEQRRRNIIR